MARSPFVWGDNGEQLTPERVEALRAAAIAAQRQAQGRPIKNVWEGLASLTDAWGGYKGNLRADREESEGRAGARDKLFNNPVLSALLGGGNVSMSSSGTLAPGQPAMIDAAPQQAALGAAPAAAVADEQAQAQAAADWLRYSNQGATRNKPLDPKLAGALSFLPELGVTMEVFSGGQDAAGSGGQRTGSTRHDHGQAADAFFYKDGRKLDWANPNDQPIFQEIVRRGKAAGVTGFGAGDGYMQPGSMHIGFGSEAVWGAGGKGENAPDWLRAAAGGPAGQVTASAQNAPSASGYAPQMQGTSPVMQALLQASTDPWVAQEYGPVLQALMGQEQSRQQFAMEQADPMRQLEMQKAQLEIEQMRNPDAPKPIEVGGVLLDPVTYQPIFDSRANGANGAVPSEVQALQWRAREAGLEPGTQPYQDFIMNGGARGTGVPAGFAALDAQAKAGGLEPGTPEYQQFMIGGGAGQRAAATATGKMQAEAQIALPSTIATAERALANIEAIRNDPALPSITGMVQGRLPPLSPAGTDLNVRINQAKGQTFLEAFESLKGAGQITEIEGQKAEQAIARLDRAQSTEAYQQALDDLADVLRSGMERARAKAGVQPPAPPMGGIMAAPPESAAVENVGPPVKRMRFDPVTGMFE